MCSRTDPSASMRSFSISARSRAGRFACTSARWRTLTASRSRTANSSSTRPRAGPASNISTTPGRWARLVGRAFAGGRCGSGASATDVFAELERLLALADTGARRPDRVSCREPRRRTLARRRLPCRGGRVRHSERAQRDPNVLDAILERQFFALHGWKLAGDLTNYRRFFDVSVLWPASGPSLPQVFAASHARIEAMIAQGRARRIAYRSSGRSCAIRVTYFERLRQLLPNGRLYVEKILENDERLVEDWPIDGTVGYDFLAKVNRLWMDDQRIDALTATYSDFTGHPVNFARTGPREEARDRRVDVLRAIRRSRQERARHRARRLADARLEPPAAARGTRTGHHFARRLSDLPHRRGAAPDDDKRVRRSDAKCAHRLAGIDGGVFDFLSALFTKPALDRREEDFVAQWQQLSPAVMAKGVEDTTFYCFDRLVSCNEVGVAGLARRNLGGEVPRVLSLPERALAEQHARHLDARQQAQRGCAHENFAAVRNSRPMGGGAASVVAAHRARLEESHARSACGVSLVPNPDRRMADQSGALLAIHAQGLP